MFFQRKQIKKTVDLAECLGAPIAKLVKTQMRKGDYWKRLPQSVTFRETKPAFYLNDGDTLHAYLVDLNKGEVVGSVYCGSSDTAIHHGKEQFSEGQTGQDGFAVFFVETYYAGNGKTAWAVTVVSPNIQKQIAA